MNTFEFFYKKINEHLGKLGDLTSQATAVMSSLMRIAPQNAVIAETGEMVEASSVLVDTVIAVKTGEVIPIDGIVVEGQCEVDEKSLTGESFPVAKQKDSTVLAGTINLNGTISLSLSLSLSNTRINQGRVVFVGKNGFEH